MTRNTIGVAALLLSAHLFGCSGDLPLNNLPTQPSHWRHVPEQGTDTRVGRLESAERKLTIHYDIGELAGEYASPDAYPDHQWVKSASYGGSSFQYLLDQDGTLYVTFPDEGPANFWAKVERQADIDYVVELLARYRQNLLLLGR